MNQKIKYAAYVAIVSVAWSLPLISYYIETADAYKRGGILEETREAFFFRGQLTQAAENNPYGGGPIGDYFVQVNVNEVKVISNLDSFQSDDKVLEAWLVDFSGKPGIYLGTYEDNELSVSLQINEWIYEAIILSEVLENLSSSENPLGGAALEKAPMHKSNKSF